MKKQVSSFIKQISFLLFLTLSLSSCRSIINLTYKNDDFEYLQNGQVTKVIIQSTRDKGFRFMVTDPETIKELYNSLSTAVPAKEKNPLAPDYIFEFHTMDNEVKKYNYIAGSSSDKEKGNLYDENSSYAVINRIDNKIIKNLNALRKPQDFSKAYFGSILDAVKAVRADYPKGALGLILNEDKEMQKYIMSFELKEFEGKLLEREGKIITSEKEAEIIVKVHTLGYKTDYIKLVVDVKDTGTRKSKSYYVLSKYIDGTWNIKVSGEKPEGW